MRTPLLRLSYGFLGALAVFALLGPWVAGLAGGNASALLAGARSTAVAAAVVGAVSFVLGLATAALAVFGPSTLDLLLSRAVEIAGALPSVVAVTVLASVGHTSSLAAIVAVLSVKRGLESAKVVRAALLQVGAEDFVLAARAAGIGTVRLLRTHFFPHVASPALSSSAMGAAAVVSLDAAGSFLGVFPNGGSWGTVLAEAARRSSLGLLSLPALGTALTIAALSVVSDAVAGKNRVGRRFL